jgi:CheY-like chemotaxis protein
MKTILVVEDETYLRDLYKQVLESEHFVVETAIDGEVALQLLQKGGYDLVLLDIVMPKIDGITVMQKLQESPPQKKNGPILFLTNSEEQTSIASGIALNARGYLIKSDYNPGQLVNEVKRILEEERVKTQV